MDAQNAPTGPWKTREQFSTTAHKALFFFTQERNDNGGMNRLRTA